MTAAGATAVAGAGEETPRPLLHAVDRTDATLMSVGTLASGVLAYAFNVLAARALGPVHSFPTRRSSDLKSVV